jgi:Protein of unknown function (DUF4236)
MSGYIRFRRRVRLAPGVWLNLNRRSVSFSAGVPGAHLTLGPRGKRASVGIPGSGLSYVASEPWRASGHGSVPQGHSPLGLILLIAAAAILIGALL